MTIDTTPLNCYDPNSITMVVDSGANQHLCYRFDLFINWRAFPTTRPVSTSTGQFLQAMGTGDVLIFPEHSPHSPGIIIKGAIYVPSLRRNILSVAAMEEKGLKIIMAKGQLTISDSRGEFLTGERVRGLYVITARTHRDPQPISAHYTNNTKNLPSEPPSLDNVISEPQDLKEVEQLPAVQRAVWIQAMEKEVESFDNHRIWSPTTLPQGETAISSRWTFKLKQDERGRNVKARARLVARGFQQEYGHQYDEVYAPVVRPTTFRTLISLAARDEWTVQHVDVDSAFLYGALKEKIYMTPPRGPIELFQGIEVYELKAAIYGLKQAARAWYSRISHSLELIHFKATMSDPCLFTGSQKHARHYIIIHVDDLLVLGPDQELVLQIISHLSQEYLLKNLGRVKCYLGQHLRYISSQKRYYLHQRDKIQALVHRLGLDKVNPYLIPLQPDYMKNKMNDNSAPFHDKTLYQSTLGSLMYLSNVSRPDIALAANLMGRSASNPSEMDWQQLIRITLYLKGTMEHALSLGSNSNPAMIAYADADWGGDPHTRRSTSGGCHLLGGSLIDWKTQRQKCVSLSTAEAEYVSAVESGRETVWLLQLFEEINHPVPLPVSQNCDNQSTIAMLGSLRHGNRSKHMEIKLNYLKELIDAGTIDMTFCPSKRMIADIFTKPLPHPRHHELSKLLGMTLDPG